MPGGNGSIITLQPGEVFTFGRGDNSDLKIELRLVQPLASTQEGAAYELPLQSEMEPGTTLDSLAVHLEVQVTHAAGLPVWRTRTGRAAAGRG